MKGKLALIIKRICDNKRLCFGVLASLFLIITTIGYLISQGLSADSIKSRVAISITSNKSSANPNELIIYKVSVKNNSSSLSRRNLKLQVKLANGTATGAKSVVRVGRLRRGARFSKTFKVVMVNNPATNFNRSEASVFYEYRARVRYKIKGRYRYKYITKRYILATVKKAINIILPAVTSVPLLVPSAPQVVPSASQKPVTTVIYEDCYVQKNCTEAEILSTRVPGPYIKLNNSQIPIGFNENDPVVGTFYFYWHKYGKTAQSSEHFYDFDGTDALTDHPVNAESYNYLDASWHRQELLNMVDTGIDISLPVFWGLPIFDDSITKKFSYTGLSPMNTATQQLIKEGRRAPKVGMFYDTTSLSAKYAPSGGIDLSTTAGKAWFYVTIRNYFSMIPPQLWATIDSKPIVYLYSANFAKSGTTSGSDLLTYVNQHFAEDFGETIPYIVKDASWGLTNASSTYFWGGALGRKVHRTITIGPGYDDAAVPRPTRTFRDRENGMFYRRNWDLLLGVKPEHRPKMLVIETWNELHEGTEIVETIEYGRMYLDMTKEYVQKWHNQYYAKPAGQYSGYKAVNSTFGNSGISQGIEYLLGPDTGEAAVRRINIGGKDAIETASPNSIKYLYFKVDNGFFFDSGNNINIEVEYYDEGSGVFSLEYDSFNSSAPWYGAYKAGGNQSFTGTGTWKTKTFSLSDAKFCDLQNANTDFRLYTANTLKIHRIIITKTSF